MSVFIRPFRASDLGAFIPIEPLSTREIKDPELAKAIEDSGLAVTAERDGKVVGCGGVHPMNDFHGEVWLRLSADCLQYKIETLRWIKSGVKIIEETYPFKQLNAVVKCCFKESMRLMEYLGFNKVEEVDYKDNAWTIFEKRIG